MRKFKLFSLLVALILSASAYADGYKVSTSPQTRHILIEDFTGFKCGNCPDAHKRIEALRTAQPEIVHSIAIHAGSFSNPNAIDQPDFRTDDGIVLHDFYGIDSYPSGIVNRHNFPNDGGLVVARNYWVRCSRTIAQDAADVNIYTESSYDSSTKKISIDVELYYPHDSIKSKTALCLSLLQNGIIGMQSGADDVNDYEHNHMLRDMITPVWGDAISDKNGTTQVENGTITVDGNYVKAHYEYDLPDGIQGVTGSKYAAIPTDPFNSDILAFVINTDEESNYEILNVTETHVNCPGVTAPMNVKLEPYKITPSRNYGFNFIECYVTNKGSETLTNLTFSVTFNEKATETNVAVNIPAHEKACVKVPVNWSKQYSDTNPYILQLTAANGKAISNQKIKGDFAGMIYVKGAVKAKIKTDNYAADNTFRVLDANGNMVYDFGPYDDGVQNTYEEKFEVTEQGGTYCFEIQDAWGDGILLPRGNIYWYDAEGKQIASNTNIADYGYRIFFQYGEGTGPGPRPDDPNDDPDNPDNPDQPDDPTPGDFTNSKWGSDGEYGLLALPSGTNEYGTERVIGADGTLWYYAYSPESDAVEDIKTTTYNLYLNAIDQKGNKLFGDKGMVVSNYPNRSWTEIGQTLYANSDGSVTMVVRDCRNDEAQGSLTYTAYRFRKDGTSVWDRDGINIDEAGNYSFACGMTITELTDGTNVFVWMRSPTYTGSSMVLERCHVSKEGVKLNKLEDLRIGNPASDYNSYPALVAGENGTYYLVYARTSSQSIYVLKYNADGSNAWPSVSSRGVSIYSGGWGSVNMLQVRLNVKSDGKGGVLIAYNAAPGSSDDPYHAYISWVRPDGSLGFTNSEGKAPVRLSYDENNAQRMPDIIPSPDGNGFVAAILYYNQAYQQYEGLTLQKIDSLGNLQWGDIGYEFQPQSSQNIGNAKLQPGYKGQFLLTWTNGSNDKPYSDTKNYYAIFNSSDHSFVHPEQGIVTMSTKQFYRTNLTSLVNKKEGYWILHWKQTYKPIYAGDREQENEDELKDHHCLALITFDGKMVVGQKEEPKELDFTNSKWGTDGVYGLRALPTGTNQYANEQVMGVDGTLWYFIYHPSHTTVADLDHTVYTMYLNGIDKMGNKMFGDLGIEISSYPNASWTKVNQYLCANSDSTVTVAISDERSGNGSNVTFTGYRFRPDGTSVWDRDGVNLDENNHYEAGVWMNIIELPNGTNVFAWTRPAVYSGQYTQYIERVHVSKEGQVLTKLDDLRLGKDAEFYADPMLVLGENGSYYMIYARTSAYSIYAKKYNADGSEAWSNVSARGLSLFTGSWGEMPTLQTRINAGRDGKGGFYITYNYQPDMSQPYHAYIAWVKPDGTLGYTNSDGKAPMRLSYDEYNCQRMPLVIPSPDGNGFIATFTEYNYGTQSYQAYIMQKIDSLGVLQWGDEGISVEPIDEQNAGSHTIQKGKDNQFMISWLIGGTYNNFNDTKHKMAIVNSEDGTYAVAPKPVYDVQANRTSLSSVINNVDGYWVMHWTQQYRPYYETDRVPTNAEEEAKDNYCLALVTFDGTVVKGAGSNVLPGDANNDGVVDVSDITAIASYILNGAATGASWNADNADANQDGQIDVSDITATAAIILGVK